MITMTMTMVIVRRPRNGIKHTQRSEEVLRGLDYTSRQTETKACVVHKVHASWRFVGPRGDVLPFVHGQSQSQTRTRSPKLVQVRCWQHFIQPI